MNLISWLTGYRVLTVERAHAAAMLELCRRGGYVYDGFHPTPEGGLALRLARPTAKAVMARCAEEGIPYTVTRGGGLPSLFGWCGRRAGLATGLILGVALLVASRFFVWDVRVTGTEQLTAHDVEATLSACGFGVGSSLVDLRADKLQNRVLMADGRIAWISVNMQGTVAHVQIRETQRATDLSDDTPSNVVAARGGTVEWVEMGEGNLLVKAGEVVKEGELLVSGLYDSYTHGYRLTHAEAKVYARTAREFEVVIPLAYERKMYIDDENAVFCEKTLNFFGKSVKFSKSTGNVGVLCDTIEEDISWGLFSDVGFPISTVKVTHVPYTMEAATRTYAEAEVLAYAELAERIAEIPDGRLLRKDVTVTLTDSEYRLHCTVVCIEDIAKVVEIPLG